jgi:hypothetical protein
MLWIGPRWIRFNTEDFVAQALGSKNCPDQIVFNPQIQTYHAAQDFIDNLLVGVEVEGQEG